MAFGKLFFAKADTGTRSNRLRNRNRYRNRKSVTEDSIPISIAISISITSRGNSVRIAVPADTALTSKKSNGTDFDLCLYPQNCHFRLPDATYFRTAVAGCDNRERIGAACPVGGQTGQSGPGSLRSGLASSRSGTHRRQADFGHFDPCRRPGRSGTNRS
jgi:hypothetical protein